MPKTYSLLDILPVYDRFGRLISSSSCADVNQKLGGYDGTGNVSVRFVEGEGKEVKLSRYERDPAARRECIRHFGAKCKICEFNFAEKYGENFEGLIHVHHLTPLYMVGEGHSVDPKTDLIPVCPNCHLALHSKEDGVYTPEELIEFMKGTGN